MMREPYETLLGQYADHWLLWKHLQGYEPDFAAIANDELLGNLSSGELLMLHVALAFWNGDRTARIADLYALDHENRERIVEAIRLTMEAVR